MGEYHETFRFDFLPHTQADVMSKWQRIKHRTDCHVRVALETLGRRPKKPLSRATLILTRASSRPKELCDADNIRVSFKPLLDGLVRAGVIEDDCIGVIGEPELRFETAKPKQGFVMIEVVA